MFRGSSCSIFLSKVRLVISYHRNQKQQHIIGPGGLVGFTYRHRLVRWISLLVAVILLISLVRNIFIFSSGSQEIEGVKLKVEEFKKEQEKLLEQISHIKSEEYIEGEARDKLGLAKEGEIVIILPDEEILKKFSTRIETQENSLPDPNWQKWLKLFL